MLGCRQGLTILGYCYAMLCYGFGISRYGGGSMGISNVYLSSSCVHDSGFEFTYSLRVLTDRLEGME